MNRNEIIPLLICCVYPIVAPLIWQAFVKFIKSRDWRALGSLHWSDIFRKGNNE
jgi:hypothetical protein